MNIKLFKGDINNINDLEFDVNEWIKASLDDDWGDPVLFIHTSLSKSQVLITVGYKSQFLKTY